MKHVPLTVFCLNPRQDQKVLVVQLLILQRSWPKLRRRLRSSRREMRWCILTAHWLECNVLVILMCSYWHVMLEVVKWLPGVLVDKRNMAVVQFSKFPSRVEILDTYLVDDRTKLLFFSLSERWSFIGRCRQARLLCLGELNHDSLSGSLKNGWTSFQWWWPHPTD